MYHYLTGVAAFFSLTSSIQALSHYQKLDFVATMQLELVFYTFNGISKELLYSNGISKCFTIVVISWMVRE